MTKILRNKRAAVPAALLILIMVLTLGRFCLFLIAPAGSGLKQELVELGRGRTLRAVAADLEQRGIISSARLFTAYARLKRADARVKAGFYQFNDGMLPARILEIMLNGEVYERLFALPPGYSSFQVAEMLEKQGLLGKEAFLAACRDRALLSDLGIGAASAEGYLFPGSYNILPGRNEHDLVREMVKRQLQLLDAGFGPRLRQSKLSRDQLLTLASMVEKEAILPAEKPLIAATFQNRLKMGMRLQSDPTALYGVRAFSGKVSRDDILKPTPYNTYLISGLPPGPIGNPGSEAIEAALNPPQVPYLYFVARGDGSHQFSTNLTAHNAAVRKFLRTATTTPSGKGNDSSNTAGRR